MGALLAAESARNESFGQTVEAAILALGLVWAAHAYAAVLGHRLGGPETSGPAGDRSSAPDAITRGAERPPSRGGSSRPEPAATEPVTGVRPLSAAELRRLLGHEFAVLKGGALPLLALLLSWATGASLGTAITVTLWTCAGTLVVAELIAGLRMSAGRLTVVLHMVMGASLGGALLALKAILH